MKKTIYAVVALIFLGTLASAQKAVKFKNGNLALQSCYGTAEGIQCDFTYRLTDRNSDTLVVQPIEYRGVTETGAEISPAISLDGSTFASNYDDAKANVKSSTPIKVVMFFNLPSDSKQISLSRYSETYFTKIPVRPYGTPAPVNTAPITPTAANTVNVNGSNYSAVLSNCKNQGGTLYCSAVLTPRK